MSWLTWENSQHCYVKRFVHVMAEWCFQDSQLCKKSGMNVEEVEKNVTMLFWIRQLDWRCVASNTHWAFWYSSSHIIRGSARHCFPAGMNYSTYCALTCSWISAKCAWSCLMWSESAGRTSAPCLCDQDSSFSLNSTQARRSRYKSSFRSL